MRAAFLIHGFASDRDDFGRIVPILSAYYDEVVCPDLPAHGVGTEKEKLNHKKILEFAEKTFDDLKARHQRVDVIGFSMGGAIASYLAANKSVDRLILLAPANKYLGTLFVFKTAARLFTAGCGGKRRKAARKKQNLLTASELCKDTRYAVKLFFGKMMKKITVKNFREFGRLVKNCDKRLKDITAPTLIIWGKIDQLVPKRSIRYVTGYCKNSFTRTIVWPDLSHLMLYSRLHFKITHEVFRFLQDTDPPLLEYKGQ